MAALIELLSNSLIASALLSVAIGVIGSIMLINRYNYLAASIAHGSYGGIGLALFFSIPLLLGATLFALFLALLLAYLTYKEPKRLDILISVIWAMGISIGIIFSDLTPGYHSDLLAYLFGDILLVPMSDIYYMLGVDIVIIIFTSRYFHYIIAIAYDKEFAITRNLPVKMIHTLILVLIALTIVMSIRSFGLILVIALFSIPPFIAEKLTKSVQTMMLVSAVIAFLLILSGLLIAYFLNISATAAIILLASSIFLLFFKGSKCK